MDTDPETVAPWVKVADLAIETMLKARDLVRQCREGQDDLAGKATVIYPGDHKKLRQLFVQVFEVCVKVQANLEFTADEGTVRGLGDEQVWKRLSTELQKFGGQTREKTSADRAKGRLRAFSKLIRRNSLARIQEIWREAVLLSTASSLQVLRDRYEQNRHLYGPTPLSTPPQSPIPLGCFDGELQTTSLSFPNQIPPDEIGKWFLGKDEYKNWKSLDNAPILWVQGSAGLGKTKLISRVIDDLSGDKLLTARYANYRLAPGKVQNVRDLLHSIYVQLSEVGGTSGSNGLLQQSRPGIERPFDLVANLLRQMFERAQSIMPVYVAIDGMDDENMMDTERLDEALGLLLHLRCKLLITSRSQPRPFLSCESYTHYQITVEDVNADLVATVVNILSHSCYNVIKVAKQKDTSVMQLAQNIVAAAEGRLFRCEALVYRLQQAPGLANVHNLIDSLASGSADALAAIDLTLDELISKCPDEAEKCSIQRSMTWLSCTPQPMPMYGLCEALTLASVKASGSEANRLNEPEESLTLESIARSCKGLISADVASETVAIRNHDIRTQVLMHWNDQLNVRQSEFGAICINYLLLDNFADGPCETLYAFDERIKHRPFFIFAACNWLSCVWPNLRSESDEEGVGVLILRFLSSPNHRSAASQALLWSQRSQNLDDDQFQRLTAQSKSMSVLDLMLGLGISQLIEEKSSNLSQESGLPSVAIDSKAHYITSTSKTPSETRSDGSKKPSDCILQRLISRFDPSFEGILTCEMILSDADAVAKFGHHVLFHAIDVERLDLLERAIDKRVGRSQQLIDSPEHPITRAILRPNPSMAVIRTLVEAIILDPPDHGTSPVQAAILIGRTDIVKYLLSRLVDAYGLTDSKLDPPIFMAIERKDSELVAMLTRLPFSCDTLFQNDRSGRSVFSRAMESGNLRIIQSVLAAQTFHYLDSPEELALALEGAKTSEVREFLRWSIKIRGQQPLNHTKPTIAPMRSLDVQVS